MTWEGVPHDHDTCPTCGPLHVTTDSTCGRTLAIRVDGKGLCTCTFEQRQKARAVAGLAVIGTITPAAEGTGAVTARGAGGRQVVRRGPRHVLSVPKASRAELVRSATEKRRRVS